MHEEFIMYAHVRTESSTKELEISAVTHAGFSGFVKFDQ